MAVTGDLDLALPMLDSFLNTVSTRVPTTAVHDFQPHVECPVFPAANLPKVVKIGEYKSIFLFETWVDEHLFSWLSTSLADDTACSDLRDLIEDYHCQASAAYNGMPINLSIMCLTI